MFAPVRNGAELNVEEQRIFFEKLVLFLQQSGGCERLLQPNPYAVLAACPEGSRHCEFGTYLIDLENQSEEQILEKFHPKYQKAVVHSIKNEAEVKIGPEVLKDFYLTYMTTMKKAGLHYDPYDYFEMLWRYMGDERVCTGVVYDNGVPVSGIFLIYTKHSAYLTHAGTQGDSKLYGAAKLLNFEMMKYLKNKGVKIYDFVGVRLKNNNPALEGIFRFKKGFGGELKEGYLWK
ncbi:MAG TPA: peptidoglycan bridge formation glycyltransferase FemA/FemB family protein, partial [Bacteroidia bacterium]|nr:peptidoglycan bridge formation glycyltransferase FemA/FemB family protein [Bacteroidia bacterium]